MTNLRKQLEAARRADDRAEKLFRAGQISREQRQAARDYMVSVGQRMMATQVGA